jgi:hypothetical protein
MLSAIGFIIPFPLNVQEWPLFSPARYDFPAGDAPISVAIGDFDFDGNEDLAVANHHCDNGAVLLGKRNGSFGTAWFYGVGDLPGSVAVGDFDSDGNSDLAVSDDGTNDISILMNARGNGFLRR